MSTSNTCRTWQAAAAAGVLPRDVADALVTAYTFLRDVENRLRVVANRAVEALPVAPEELAILVRRMYHHAYRNHAEIAPFQAAYHQHRDVITLHFRRFFAEGR